MERPVTAKKPASPTRSGTKTVASEKKAAVSATAVTQATNDKPATAKVGKPRCAAETARTKSAAEQTTCSSHKEVCRHALALRAYYLWEQGGYQHGRDREYWLKAEEILQKEMQK